MVAGPWEASGHGHTPLRDRRPDHPRRAPAAGRRGGGDARPGPRPGGGAARLERRPAGLRRRRPGQGAGPAGAAASRGRAPRGVRRRARRRLPYGARARRRERRRAAPVVRLGRRADGRRRRHQSARLDDHRRDRRLGRRRRLDVRLCAGPDGGPVGAGRRHRRRPARPGRRPGPRARRARRHPLGRALPDHGPVQRALAARLPAAARRARRADLVPRTAGQPPGLRRPQRDRRRPARPPDRRRRPAAQRRPLGRGAGGPLRPGVRADRADRRRAGVGGAPVRPVPRPDVAAAGRARRTRPGRCRGPADLGPGRRADARPARPRGGDRPRARAGAVAARSARPHRPRACSPTWRRLRRAA